MFKLLEKPLIRLKLSINFDWITSNINVIREIKRFFGGKWNGFRKDMLLQLAIRI